MFREERSHGAALRQDHAKDAARRSALADDGSSVCKKRRRQGGAENRATSYVKDPSPGKSMSTTRSSVHSAILIWTVATSMAVLALLASFSNGADLHAQAALPARLDSYIKQHVRLTTAQRNELLAGQPVTRLLDADASHEVSVFGAIWVNAPISRYVAAVKNIEEFEKGGSFLITKKISAPPQLEDFAPLRLPPDDVKDLQRCKVGSCELKLSEATLVRIRKEIDWSKPTATADVERLTRRLTLDYVNGYREGGNARLAVYRDSSRPTFVGQEFASMVERMPSLTEYLPSLKRYLLDFPKASLPNSESFFYWQEARFGLKPTIRVNHVTIAEDPTHAVVASKMLYATHYFWTALELRVLVPDPARGKGFWFANVNRSRSDGLTGFTGSVIGGKVRREAENGMQAALAITKSRMEQP
jgi:hypothetical protein